MIRLVHLLRRTSGTSAAEFTAYWRDEHAPRVAYHQKRLELLRYVQTHPDAAAETGDRRASEARGGMAPPWDGISETWWASEQALAGVLTSQMGRAALKDIVADELVFTDGAASPLWLALEYPQVSVSRERAVARPRTGVMRVHMALQPREGMGFDEAQRYWRSVHGPLLRQHAPARGMLCYQQVHRFDSPLAAALSAPRGSSAGAFMGHAEAWYDRLAMPTGPETDDAMAVAIADERNFIDLRHSVLLTGKELVFVDRSWI